MVGSKFTEQSARALCEQAHQAGMAALEAATPRPMLVGTAVGLSNQIDYTKPTYYETQGVCGFAWVNVKGNTSFGRLFSKVSHASKDSYYGGVSYWVREGGQSYERKMAYANAFAEVLNQAGVVAHAYGRLD